MNIRLTEALAELAENPPDTGEVLARVREGVGRNRRRQQYRLAAAGLAVVMAVGGGGLAVNSLGGQPDLLAAGAAGPAKQPTGRCEVKLGWLPDGLPSPWRMCGPGRQGILYPGDLGPPYAVRSG